MKIVFGLYLDGPSAPPILPPGRRAVEGVLRAGPRRLLETLETRLGLTGAWTPAPVRVIQYHARLLAAGTGRSFSRSLETYPLGTARLLLGWRDDLVEIGWTGTATRGASALVADLAAVEKIGPAPALDAGPADRLRRVLSSLRDCNPRVGSVELVEPFALLPPCWREVVTAMARHGCAITTLPAPNPEAAGNLRILQEFLDGRTGGTLDPGDRSVVLLTAGSDTEAAEALALWLEKETAGTVVVMPREDDALDRALRRRGLPVTGIAPASPWRPALQVLPLAVELRWRPLDPRRLQEFLMLPIGPLRRDVGMLLAGAVSDQPGIGGPSWRGELEDWRRRRLARAAAQLGEGADAERTADREWRDVRERLATWIDVERFDPDEGIPRSELEALCGRVASWAKALDEAPGRDTSTVRDLALDEAIAQAVTVRQMLGLLPGPLVSRKVWAGLLDLAAGGGVDLPGGGAERGCVAAVHHPGALLDSVDRVVWWDFTEASAPSPSAGPWTLADRTAFGAAGLELEDAGPIRRRFDWAARRAMACARRQLILVRPLTRRGEPAALHPAFAWVAAALAPRPGDPPQIDLNARRFSLAGVPAEAAGLLETLPPRGLPRRLRHWILPPGTCFDTPEHESYTSVEKFIECPFLYLLERLARIRGRSLEPLKSVRRVSSQIAHRLLQEAVQDDARSGLSRPDRLEPWLSRRLSAALPEEGALLLLPALRARLHHLKRVLARGIPILIGAMEAGGWKLIPAEDGRGLAGAEVALEGTFAGRRVRGVLDLFLENPGGERAILDLKWGARPESGRLSLQLLFYGNLGRSATGAWPRLGHFFVEEARLSPRILAGGNPRSAAECEAQLRQCEQSWAWRQAELEAGLVEVPVRGAEPVSFPADRQPAPCPGDARQPERTYRWIDEYDRIAGWSNVPEGDEGDS